MPCSMYAIIYGNDMAISWHTLMVYMERGEGKSTNHQHHLIAQRVESPHPSVDRSTCNFKRRSHWNTVPGYTQFGSRYLRTKRMVLEVSSYETRSNGRCRGVERRTSDGQMVLDPGREMHESPLYWDLVAIPPPQKMAFSERALSFPPKTTP